jgi:iron-sulfur cluster assembly protein
MITLTPAAIEKIKTQLKQRGKGLGIRIGVKPTGCSGLAYTIEFTDHFEVNDYVFDFEDCKILVNAQSIEYLTGMNVDYVKRGLGEGFEFTNPLEKSRCGCGISFRV